MLVKLLPSSDLIYWFSIVFIIRMRSALASLAVTAALTQQACAEFVIEEDAYFYGQSEPVYPTRESFNEKKTLVVDLFWHH